MRCQQFFLVSCLCVCKISKSPKASWRSTSWISWNVSKRKKQHVNNLSVRLYCIYFMKNYARTPYVSNKDHKHILLCSFGLWGIRGPWDSYFLWDKWASLSQVVKRGMRGRVDFKCLGPPSSHLICSEVWGPSTSPWHDFITPNV